jgi:ElaB/YqjD/DUF883 family membrane-anchored ribosome-binding protein
MRIETITPQGTVESSKQALVNDLKRVVGDAEDLLNNIAGATADEFTLARGKLEARLDQAKSRLLDACSMYGSAQSKLGNPHNLAAASCVYFACDKGCSIGHPARRSAGKRSWT